MKWTPRSPGHISTPRTAPATQGDGPNDKNPRGELADHGIGRSRSGLSTKIHQLIDGAGLPLVSLITAGHAGDSLTLLPLLGQLRVACPVGRFRTRPDAVLGEKAYSSRAIRTHLGARGIRTVIPEPADRQDHRKCRGSRGGRPMGLDAAAYKGRDTIERQYAQLKQWRGLATRYDKYAIVYRAAVVLKAVLTWSKRLSDTP